MRRHDNRFAVGGAENIVRRHHKHACFELGLQRQRHVHRHLIAVKVGVKRGTDQRMQLNGLAFDQHRFECLDTQAMQCGCPVQHYWMFADHLF